MSRLHDTNFSSNKRRGREGKEKPFFKFLNQTLTINKNRATGLSFSPQKQTTVHSNLLTAHSRTPLKYQTKFYSLKKKIKEKMKQSKNCRVTLKDAGSLGFSSSFITSIGLHFKVTKNLPSFFFDLSPLSPLFLQAILGNKPQKELLKCQPLKLQDLWQGGQKGNRNG